MTAPTRRSAATDVGAPTNDDWLSNRMLVAYCTERGMPEPGPSRYRAQRMLFPCGDNNEIERALVNATTIEINSTGEMPPGFAGQYRVLVVGPPVAVERARADARVRMDRQAAHLKTTAQHTDNTSELTLSPTQTIAIQFAHSIPPGASVNAIYAAVPHLGAAGRDAARAALAAGGRVLWLHADGDLADDDCDIVAEFRTSTGPGSRAQRAR